MAQSKEMKAVIKRLEKVYFKIDEVIEKRIQANERFIINLNAAQMYRGEKADGTEIKPSYAPSTIRYKKKVGQPYNRVTLRDSGDFQFKELKVIDLLSKIIALLFFLQLAISINLVPKLFIIFSLFFTKKIFIFFKTDQTFLVEIY